MRAASTEYSSLNPASDPSPEIPLENVLVVYKDKISLAHLEDIPAVLAAKVAQAGVDPGCRIILAESYWQRTYWQPLAEALGAARRNSR